MNNLNTLKTEFLSQYALASKLTKDKYKRELELFLDVCDIHTNDDLNSINQETVNKFYEYAEKNEWSPCTINQRLGVIKLFTAWCFKKHYTNDDIFADVKRMRTANFVHYVPSELECDTLLEYIKTHKEGKRLYLMTKLMLTTGLRRMEICNLKISDLDKENSVIRIEGKGKKFVEQPVPSSIVVELVEYINTERRLVMEKYKAIGGKDKDYLFVSGIGDKVNTETKDLKNGNKVNDNGFYQQVKRYAKLAGIDNWDKISVHSLRRRAGTSIYEKTGDIRTAQEFLRHSSITTTEQCYINYNKDKLKNAVNEIYEDKTSNLSNDEEYQLFLLLKKKFANM